MILHCCERWTLFGSQQSLRYKRIGSITMTLKEYIQSVQPGRKKERLLSSVHESLYFSEVPSQILLHHSQNKFYS